MKEVIIKWDKHNLFNMQAGAADALVNGGILVPEFQKEIVDIVRRIWSAI